jgi:acyl-coenzyme A thioesterase PaaI-like protein
MNPTEPLSASERVRAAVLAMPVAKALQLQFKRVEPGDVELELPISEAFSFRPGQLQATAVFAAGDFAAVAAAGTLLAPGFVNATIDATLKIVAPACGTKLRARGRVVDAGKLLTVCAAEVYAVDADEHETLCATLLGTARNVPVPA